MNSDGFLGNVPKVYIGLMQIHDGCLNQLGNVLSTKVIA